MQDIRQLYEGLDSTSGTRFPQSRMIGRGESKLPRRARGEQAQKSTRSRDKTEVEAQKTVEAHNEVQKVVQGILSQKHQKHQQQDNGSHNVSDMKRSRPTGSQARNPRLQKSAKFETQTLNRTLEIKGTATSTSTRP